jgi:hypothetical protein
MVRSGVHSRVKPLLQFFFLLLCLTPSDAESGEENVASTLEFACSRAALVILLFQIKVLFC